MKRTKKTWIAALLGGLLLATLVGVVWAVPKAHHAGFHYTATIPGAHFHPRRDACGYYNNGEYIYMQSGSCVFTAAVPMLPGNRTVESVTMYVTDNNGSVEACVELNRTKTDGTQATMASVCSSGSSSSIRSFSDTSISPSTVWGGHGAYLHLLIQGTSISVYDVQIKYY